MNNAGQVTLATRPATVNLMGTMRMWRDRSERISFFKLFLFVCTQVCVCVCVSVFVCVCLCAREQV